MTCHVLVLEREHPADLDFYRAELGKAAPDVIVHTAFNEAEALAAAPVCSVIMAKAHHVTPALLQAAPGLEWVQALTTGVEHLEQIGLPDGVALTSARGVHGPQMSELAFLMMIALIRDYSRMRENQKRQVWERWPQRLLYGKTAVLVGVGTISEALAARCKVFGMTVVGVSSTPREAPGFDEVVPYAALTDAAARADFLILLCPYSARTHHLIDAGVLGRMKKYAVLVNIARGKVVDEPALIAALQNGGLAGAGLDVFHDEPLPPTSPLWSMENVIVTPRIGGMSDQYAQQLLPLIVRNLNAWTQGRREDMVNVVARGAAGEGR